MPSGILHVLEKLAAAIENKAGLVDRIQKLENDSALFERKNTSADFLAWRATTKWQRVLFFKNDVSVCKERNLVAVRFAVIRSSWIQPSKFYY
jgi:hypothetical protein